MSERAKIRARRVTGNDAQQQREVARAIKNAREMALLPYANRITTQRSPRGVGRRPRRPVLERSAAAADHAAAGSAGDADVDDADELDVDLDVGPADVEVGDEGEE